ncbi:hypothetical protein LSTR_LSTR011324 [Laodelphax striatellus]|uniref:MADF domain-containing protein n=1 Tax=Laodelphax striatellus TaxID=195883 RepID=A0A482WG78_LAOST|nr:hypothetical protein LSTR_LSTR011324 [Laodelphax striatellus]
MTTMKVRLHLNAPKFSKPDALCVYVSCNWSDSKKIHMIYMKLKGTALNYFKSHVNFSDVTSLPTFDAVKKLLIERYSKKLPEQYYYGTARVHANSDSDSDSDFWRQEWHLHLNGSGHSGSRRKPSPCADAELRKKWKYLRDQFAVELGKIKPSCSGDPGSTYEPRWPHFKSLMFLKDVVEARPSSGNLTTKKKSTHDDTEVSNVEGNVGGCGQSNDLQANKEGTSDNSTLVPKTEFDDTDEPESRATTANFVDISWKRK